MLDKQVLQICNFESIGLLTNVVVISVQCYLNNGSILYEITIDSKWPLCVAVIWRNERENFEATFCNASIEMDAQSSQVNCWSCSKVWGWYPGSMEDNPNLSMSLGNRQSDGSKVFNVARKLFQNLNITRSVHSFHLGKGSHFTPYFIQNKYFSEYSDFAWDTHGC